MAQKTILITGGSGLIGKALSTELAAEGHIIRWLSRAAARSTPDIESFMWDPAAGYLDPAALTDVNIIVHLAGAGIGDQRWSAQRKRQILDSRVRSLELVRQVLQNSGQQIDTLVSGSAIGWYGARTVAEEMTESAPPADDFLGQTCRQWEQAADAFSDLAGRIVKIRTGVVLSRAGGALGKMAPPVRLGIGSPLGSGKQALPWIHMADVVGIFLAAIHNSELQGVYNAVAPASDTLDKFLRQLAKTLHRPYFFPPVPAFVLKAVFGERAALFLEGSPVSANKIQQSGYRFRFPDLNSALSELFA